MILAKATRFASSSVSVPRAELLAVDRPQRREVDLRPPRCCVPTQSPHAVPHAVPPRSPHAVRCVPTQSGRHSMWSDFVRFTLISWANHRFLLLDRCVLKPHIVTSVEFNSMTLSHGSDHERSGLQELLYATRRDSATTIRSTPMCVRRRTNHEAGGAAL